MYAINNSLCFAPQSAKKALQRYKKISEWQKKKQANSYESIMKDLKAQIYFPVYILMGDESFYIDKLCDYITENVLQPEEKDFNQVILFGADTTASQVVDQCKGIL